MLDTLVHRGPDAGAMWVDEAAGLGLGHRRLAIVDLTPTGAQPMHSADGRYVIVFNGEIYNFRDLRTELEQKGTGFRGTSDTEVLLEAITAWGVAAAIRRCVGMFALAVYDRRERRLHLVRDRLGEKPFYYGWSGGSFLFGSELKALRAHPAWRGEIDRDALSAYFRQSFVPAPFTIYQGIAKLPTGGMLCIDLNKLVPGQMPEPSLYWNLTEVVQGGQQRPFAGTDEEALNDLDCILGRAVRQQMVADVPLGAFLSGGVDSSVIVALMQRQSSRPVKTFTIGFAEAEYNEAVHAKAVANHLGTDHTELYVQPADALAVIPRLPEIYDEPFADSSQIPTYLVSALARRHVTVSLSGDAGDELFGGYRRYSDTLRAWRKIGWAPRLLRQAVAEMIEAIPARTWEKLVGKLVPRLAGKEWRERTGDRLHKLAGLIGEPDAIGFYLHYLCRNQSAANVVLGHRQRRLPVELLSDCDVGSSLLTKMTFLDMASYLPDCILTKVDRAAMAVSLESRVPLLDHRVVEFACALPDRFKLRDGQSKWLLRELLYGHVPRRLIDRPKMGFGVPIEEWLRGPLREWAESLLDERRLRREGLLDPVPIRKKWKEHLSGTCRWHYYLWDVLMFQAWLEAQRRN